MLASRREASSAQGSRARRRGEHRKAHLLACGVLVASSCPKQAGAVQNATAAAFDCDAGLANWVLGWGVEKKIWCCHTKAVGCDAARGVTKRFDCDDKSAQHWRPDHVDYCCFYAGLACSRARKDVADRTSDAHVSGYDCNHRLDSWTTEWGFGKRAHCCKTANKGCRHFNCSTDSADTVQAWSREQGSWCCSHTGKGCPDTGQEYDCDRFYEDRDTRWDEQKAAWCCAKQGRGCKADTSQTFDCDRGFANWEVQWGYAKRRWCCRHRERGCWWRAFDCSAGAALWDVGWSPKKKAWCCDHTGVGCMHYNCKDGLASWREGWAKEKKDWCCRRTGDGCEKQRGRAAIPVSRHYDCSGTSASWKEEQREWCCEHEEQGCIAFSCDGEADIWSMAWSGRKKAWCCQKDAQFCVKRVAGPDFACDDGQSSDWPEDKRRWCCQFDLLNLPSGACTAVAKDMSQSLFDCDRESANWNAAWSHAKKSWCCAWKGKGCPPVPAGHTHDCNAGIANPDTLWSDGKKAWCCEHVHVGCPVAFALPTTPKPRVILSCALNCYGKGAQDVVFPGLGNLIQGLTLAQCRQRCFDTKGCEGVTFADTDQTTPSRCFGKKDIHTSLCQPGGMYQTDIIGERPWGKCALVGDPHILTFDRPYGPSLEQIGAGDFYLIKSTDLKVQARYGPTNTFPLATSTTGIAVAGNVIRGHTLVVEYVGPEQGYNGFRAFWDDERILETLPSIYESKDEVLLARFAMMNPSDYHREARSTIGGSEGELRPSYVFELGPDLRIFMLIGPESVNVVVEARRMAEGQDGYCGNFNCNMEDDSLDNLRQRGSLANRVPRDESLFETSGLRAAGHQHPKGQPSTKALETRRQILDECFDQLRERAEKECGALAEMEREDCVFDACAAGSSNIIRDDIAGSDFAKSIDPATTGRGVGVADMIVAKKFRQQEAIMMGLLPMGQGISSLLAVLFTVGMLFAGIGYMGLFGCRRPAPQTDDARSLSRAAGRLSRCPSRPGGFSQHLFSRPLGEGVAYDYIPVEESPIEMDEY